MAKKKKKQETESTEPRIVGKLGANGEIAPFESARVLGRVDEQGNRVAYIQAQKEDIAPVKKKDTWFKNGMDDSGYAYTGTLDKINRFNASVLMTGVDILGNVGLGITKPVEGVGDFVQNRTADVLDFFGGDKAAEKVRKSAEKQWGVNRELEQSLASDNGMGIDDMSFLGTKGKSIPQGLGSVLLASATGGAGGAVFGTTAGASATSLGIMGLGAAGNAEQEALEQGATREEARMYGLISGVGETLSEMMFGGLSKSSQVLGIGTGVFDSFDDAVASGLTKKIENKIVKNLLQAGVKATGEGVEEVVSGLFDAVGKKLTYMKEEDIKKLIEDENLLDSFLSGAFSAAISQAPGYVQSITTTENGKVRLQTNEEIRDYITNLNAQEQRVVEQEIQDRIKEEGKVTNKRRIEIEKQVIEDLDRGYISADKIEKTLGENYNAERDIRLNESFNERTRRSQAYENDLSKYDEKQRKVIQTAIDSGLLNNSNKTHDFVDLIAKLSADKGIDFDFTNNERIKDTGFAVEGKTVNGFIKDGKVTLNLESNQALNKTVGHEITHVLEGTDLYNNLQDSLKSFIGEREWNNRISELEKTYKNVKGANIENELASDLVGEYVFNDESFVRSLSTKNPNLFQKIFDEIKYMVKIATAGSKEARDLEKVKRAFEKAYRETSKTQQGTQYSLEQNYRGSHQIEDGTSIVNLDLNNIRNQIEEIDGYITRETEKDFNKLKKILNNQEGNIKIYRAAPVGELNNGDWVTTDKSYAKNVANNNGGKVYEYEVKANELNYPSNIKELPSLHRLSSFQYTGENQQNVKYSLSKDSDGRQLSENQNNESEKITLTDGRTYNNYYEFAKDITKNNDELAKELLFKHYSQNFDVPANSNETKFYHGTDATFDYDGLKVMDFDEQTMDRNYGDYFYITTDKDFSHTYGSQIAEFIIPNDKILSLEDYRQNYSNKTDDELFNDYWALEMPDNEYIVKDIKPIIDYSKQRANEYINQQENTKYSLTTDNQGRELSEQQQEYFKDSKVRDEDGKLMEVYHGTPNGGFTIFDKNKTSRSGRLAQYGHGFYFTNRENVANEYRYSEDGTANNSTQYNVYLDIKNPFEMTIKNENEHNLDRNKLKQLLVEGTSDYFFDSWIPFSTKTINELNYKLDGLTEEQIKNLSKEEKVDYWLRQEYDAKNFGDKNILQEMYRAYNTNEELIDNFQKIFGYDGIIATNPNGTNQYIVFNSNQIKNVDNTNPTSNPDIRYQLGNNEVAPTSGWNVRSEDVRLQSAFKEAIAPLQEQVQELTKTIQNIVPSRALTEEEANEYATQTQEAFENEAAPIRNNLTEEENQRMSILELLERNNMLTDEQRSEMNQLGNKINPTYEEEVSPVRELSDIRDINEVGKRNVKAYQFEHPEVKPYFQEEARVLLSELDNSTKAERFVTERNDSMYGDWHGIRRNTSSDIAAMLDGELGTNYTYDDIRKGLNAIIEDHGAENIAVAKRIEFVLDERLRNGYEAWSGYTLEDENGEALRVQPNQDYLNMLREQEWNDYFEDLQRQYPFELEEAPEETIEEVPQYAIEDEETDFSDVKIDKDLQDMTVDDLNLEPFLQGLVKSSENQAERQQLRNELNEKREVKVPKNPSLNKAKNRGLGLLVNEFAEIDDYAKRTGNKDIKFKADTYNNYQAIAQSNIETAQTDINGKRIGRSGNSIFEEAKKYGLEETFDEYLKQWANVDRAKQGKGAANYTASESYKIVKEMEARNPKLKELGNDMWQYYRNARHNLRDAGIISQEVSDMLGRMYPHYTPYISEDIENYFTEDGVLKPKSTIKRAKGGAAIGSLLSAEEAMQRYTKSEFNTIFGNDLFKEIVNTSNDIVQLGGDDRGMQFVNADNLYADKTGYYLTAYEDGNPITARISEEMYRTLMRESKNRINDIEQTFSLVTKPLQAASNIRRNILTSWSPTFIAKNFIKDFQEGIFNSKYTKDFIKNYPTAFKELATNTELAQQFKSLYGSGLTMGQYDIDANNYNPSGKNRNFLKGIKNANELIELAPRFAEFKASIDHGASLQEAMYNAREVTTNFSRGGTLAKALNRNGFTFLNSSIQGFDKFIRNFSGENGAKGVVNSLAKAVIFGIAPAIFNELAFGTGDDKDEDYEALPDYIKDNYYIIKLGKNQGEYDDNGNVIKIGESTFLRIPKGRVLSVFGSAARRTIEAMEGEENAFEGFSDNVWQQIGINNPEENNIFAPFIQAMGGRKLDSGQTAGSAWYGGDIIPSRLQKERPEDQYDASIDKLSIWLGQKTGISPYKINYVLDQYTGGIGDLAIPMMTEEANSDGSIIAPIKDQFTADSTTDNKYVSEFYDTYNKIYTGSKKTDEDVLQKNYMSNISYQMSDLYKERREIQADTTLTKKEKYEKAQAIKAEINRLAKEGLDNYKNISVTGDYAEINGQEYQKTDDGWKKLSSNTSDDVNSLGLTNREKNNYIKTQQSISSIKQKYKGEDDYVGKKQDIIGEIINTNLDDEAKMNLYQDTYKDKFSNYATDLGFDADTYLEYKAQDFSADKDKNGKSISGSKKRKVFDYVNSMDIPYEQKLLLVKSEYNSFNDNNVEIIEYIENSGMSYDDKMDLYKSLGFKIDGDTISW